MLFIKITFDGNRIEDKRFSSVVYAEARMYLYETSHLGMFIYFILHRVMLSDLHLNPISVYLSQ